MAQREGNEVEPEVRDEERHALSELMRADAGATARVATERDALTEAEAALRAAHQVLAEVDELREFAAQRDPAHGRRLLLLVRVVLAASLLGLCIAVATSRGTDDLPDMPVTDAPRLDPRLVVPVDARYDAALAAAAGGDYARASRLMGDWLGAHPDLHPSLVMGPRLLHGRFLRLSGDVDRAIEVESLALRAVGEPTGSDAAWRAASASRARGDVDAMRRAHAELLLHRGRLTPTQLAELEAASLEIGDTAAVAERGEPR